MFTVFGLLHIEMIYSFNVQNYIIIELVSILAPFFKLSGNERTSIELLSYLLAKSARVLER